MRVFLLFIGVAILLAVVLPGTAQPPTPPPDALNVRLRWAATPPSIPVDVTFPIRRGVGPLPMWEGSYTLSPAQHPSQRTIYVRWYQTLDLKRPYLDVTCHANGFSPTLVRPLDNPSVLVPVQLYYTHATESTGNPSGPVAVRYVLYGVAFGTAPVDANASERGVFHYVAARGGSVTLVDVTE